MASHLPHAIFQLEVPTIASGLRSFLRLCNVFRRFIPCSTTIGWPLSKKNFVKHKPKRLERLLKKKLQALETLKEEPISPPVLAVPKNNEHYTFHTEACVRHFGCVLVQKQKDGTTKPIDYWP